GAAEGRGEPGAAAANAPRRPAGDFEDWVSGPLAIAWRPYCLLSSNCQHYARDLQNFLMDPDQTSCLKDDREVVLAAVRHEGLRLRLAAEGLRADRGVVLAAVECDGEAERPRRRELFGGGR
ncbi:unnamed protein product, partial [Prorocentrum cordatum]